jgi:DNA-directed RNA polymerase specialized sigma24 family protein
MADAVRAYLATPESQKRIRAIVAARVDRATPESVIDEIVQEANLGALASRAGPRSVDTLPGWVATITARAVVTHFRRRATDRRWHAPDVDVEEQPSAAPATDGWLVAEWLTSAVGGDPRAQETFELLTYKARTGKSHQVVADEHGMTASALSNRIHEFKKQHKPLWERHKRESVLWWVTRAALAVVVALVAWGLGWWFLRAMAPSVTPPVPSPLLPTEPTPSSTATTTPFAPANSTLLPPVPPKPPVQ